MIPAAARGTTYSGLMHAVDVAATILALGGVNISDLALSQSAPLDGLNFWDAIIGGKNTSIRDHVPLNIVNNGTSYSAVRFGDMKLILVRPVCLELPKLAMVFWRAGRTCQASTCASKALIYSTSLPIHTN